MKYVKSALLFLPLLLGILASLLAQWLFSPVPLLQFRIDLGMTAFVAGLILTLFLLAARGGSWREQGKAQQKIEAIHRAEAESRRQFIRRLDHEIKNPLTGLQAALVNLQEAETEDEHQRSAENARRTLERLSTLMRDLRKLSELEERSLELSQVNIPELLEEMVDAACSLPSYEERKVQVVASNVPWPLPALTADRDLLGLGLYNLIQNALKFSGQEDAVEVRAREDGKSLVIEVADAGPGIPPDDLGHIFEELYRGANARGVEGSGLGLALVRRIVSLHGGELGVRSRQGGARGTVFSVRLPLGSKL
jgi:signal transduction histidine kinase